MPREVRQVRDALQSEFGGLIDMSDEMRGGGDRPEAGGPGLTVPRRLRPHGALPA